MTSLKIDDSKEWVKKPKFCNLESILRKKKRTIGIDALHSIPFSECEEKLASSWRLAHIVQMLCILVVDYLNFQVVIIKYKKVIYI